MSGTPLPCGHSRGLPCLGIVESRHRRQTRWRLFAGVVTSGFHAATHLWRSRRIRSGTALVPACILCGVIRRILAPFLEVGFGALRQIFLPRRLERSAGLIERHGGAVSLLAGIAQILRMSSVARFHCETVSAIMLVEFMAVWLSWA